MDETLLTFLNVFGHMGAAETSFKPNTAMLSPYKDDLPNKANRCLFTQLADMEQH